MRRVKLQPCSMRCGHQTTSLICESCRAKLAAERIGVASPADLALAHLAAAEGFLIALLSDRMFSTAHLCATEARRHLKDAKRALQDGKRARGKGGK